MIDTDRLTSILTAILLITIAAGPALAIGKCGSGYRNNCVVDGDTFWLDGTKYRTAGYDTPEPYTNICGGRYERQLAARATARFIQLWNTTDIEIYAVGGRGRYNRDLVNVYSNGVDIGQILISEGLARRWPNGREFWCE